MTPPTHATPTPAETAVPAATVIWLLIVTGGSAGPAEAEADTVTDADADGDRDWYIYGAYPTRDAAQAVAARLEPPGGCEIVPTRLAREG